MKSKLLMLVIFLSIHCIVNSQDTSTTGNKNYMFNEQQVRRMYELKLINDFTQQQNQILQTMVSVCDSTNHLNEEAKIELGKQLEIKISENSNLSMINDLEKEKYINATQEIKALKKQKKLFVGTTSIGVILAIVAFIL